jgi:thymidylate synthase
MNYKHEDGTPFTKEEFLQKLKTDREFNDEFGNKGIDQISDLIKQLKENPDSRRILVSAWNISDLPHQVLPPCHYSFQVYTRELSSQERMDVYNKSNWNKDIFPSDVSGWNRLLDTYNIPTRAISLMFNMRSIDTFLGLPFNIASYGLLLEIIAKAVNMVPDELIGNLGDVHLYSNHIEQAKEQIGRELTREERYNLMPSITGHSEGNIATRKKINNFEGNTPGISYHEEWLDSFNIPKRTREPYPLPILNINTEFWPTESGSCGEGPIDAIAVFNSFKDDNFCKCLLEEDIQLTNYESHPAIKAPLSN